MKNNMNLSKILVFSDSHGVNIFLRKALNLHLDESDIIIHLGDGIREFHHMCGDINDKKIYTVKGNCDDIPAPMTEIFECRGYRIMLCHGSSYGVKDGFEMLIVNAKRNDIDIVLFGHTHLALNQYIPAAELGRERSLYLINPGSITSPRDGKPSYAIIELSESGVYSNCVRI